MKKDYSGCRAHDVQVWRPEGEFQWWQTDRMKSTKCGPSPHYKMVLLPVLRHSWQLSETMIKSAGTIEQKGVAQLLQIEEVRLNHYMHRKLAFSSLLHNLKRTLLGSIHCMQTFFYLEEVSRHCQSYLQRGTTRKMTGKYLYTTIAHKRNRIKKIPTIFLRILTCSIIWCLWKP